MSRLPAIFLCSVFIGVTVCAAPTQTAASASRTTLHIAVAANFRAAAQRLVMAFEQDTGIRSQLIFASTGVLTAQLRRGAPFDILLAADQARPEALSKEGFTLGPAQCYAQGSLVLLGANSLDAARIRVTNEGSRIAIANPRSAPYGKAAMSLLDSDHFGGINRSDIVMGTNVQQAVLFYHSGAADLALVARALSLDEGVPIPREWHATINQYAVINAATARADAARQFLDFLLSDGTHSTLAAFGYTACS